MVQKFDDLQAKMASVFGETGNLQVFVEQYKIEKEKTATEIEQIKKRHSGLKQRVREDYEEIINCTNTYDKRFIKLEALQTGLNQQLLAHKIEKKDNLNKMTQEFIDIEDWKQSFSRQANFLFEKMQDATKKCIDQSEVLRVEYQNLKDPIQNVIENAAS